MEYLPTDDWVLKFHPDTLEAVRKDVGLENPVRMNEAINILEDWIQKQSHFNKKDFSRIYLERTIIMSKGLVERAKRRIEKLSTFRTLMPEFFVNITADEFSDLSNILYHGHMPILTKEQYRVYVLKLFSKNLESDMLTKFYRNTVMFAEYLRKNDYCSGYQIILDFRECNIMQFLNKVNPLDLRQIMMLVTEGYAMRLKGIHIISSSKMVDGIVALFKQILSPKLAGRISVYKTVDSLVEFIPKDSIPVEYGGTAEPLKEINEKWLKAISTPEFRQYYEDMLKSNTDESRRQSNSFNEEYAGTPGSFRALVVD